VCFCLSEGIVYSCLLLMISPLISLLGKNRIVRWGMVSISDITLPDSYHSTIVAVIIQIK